jgi:large subunit ribosomal protein L34
MTKRTFGGTLLKAIKVSGFRARMSTKNGQKILATRRKRGRKLLSPLFSKSR